MYFQEASFPRSALFAHIKQVNTTGNLVPVAPISEHDEDYHW